MPRIPFTSNKIKSYPLFFEDNSLIPAIRVILSFLNKASSLPFLYKSNSLQQTHYRQN